MGKWAKAADLLVEADEALDDAALLDDDDERLRLVAGAEALLAWAKDLRDAALAEGTITPRRRARAEVFLAQLQLVVDLEKRLVNMGPDRES